ncbi:hypothetical protein COY95_00855, partial [Candidatus Woesearchaeota archaeon CG_4_10_14_0_8_um_filter_47_5]
MEGQNIIKERGATVTMDDDGFLQAAPHPSQRIRQTEKKPGKEEVLEKLDEGLKAPVTPTATQNPAPPQYKDSTDNPDHYFYHRNGTAIKSLPELLEILRRTDDESFHHHLSQHHNDYANWVEHVFGNYELALQLRTVHDKPGTLTILEHALSRPLTPTSPTQHPEESFREPQEAQGEEENDLLEIDPLHKINDQLL